MRNEKARHKLFQSLKEALGDSNAATLMEALPPFPWSEIATKADVVAEGEKIRSEIKLLTARMIFANLMLAIAVAGLVLAAVSIAR